jgi:antitoxin ChpS
MGHPARLRKVGGSIMVAIPPAVLEELKLKADTDVSLSVKAGQLVINPRQRPRKRPRYTLDELLAQCRPSRRRTKEEREWLSSPPVGRELI